MFVLSVSCSKSFGCDGMPKHQCDDGRNQWSLRAKRAANRRRAIKLTFLNFRCFRGRESRKPQKPTMQPWRPITTPPHKHHRLCRMVGPDVTSTCHARIVTVVKPSSRKHFFVAIINHPRPPNAFRVHSILHITLKKSR